MKRMSLKLKMLLCILPVMAIAMIILTLVAVNSSKSAIQDQTVATVNAHLEASVNKINGELEVVRRSATNIAAAVSSSYQNADMASYGAQLSEIVMENETITGAGLWFEPNVYDPAEKYVGPYWYLDGSSIVETWDYSNAEYDYFNQEYYTNAKALGQGKAIITDPYYDPTSGTVMASCSAPIYDGNNFIGCVTVDMSLEKITDMISAIQVGSTGKAILTTADGIYIYAEDPAKIADATSITDDENASLAAVGASMVAHSSEEAGIGGYQDGGTSFVAFYTMVPEVNWKLMIHMEEAEINSVANHISSLMTIILIVSLVISAVIILVFVMSISKSIVNVKKFAGMLASGDFTVEKIRNKRKDELGEMSDSLNDMFESNREVISRISNESTRVGETSTNLNAMAETLSTQFAQIKQNMSGVNDAMMSSSAATEEMNASIEEIDASIQTLAEETEETNTTAAEIVKRANRIEKQSKESFDNAVEMAEKRQEDLERANEKAAVVDQVGTLADTIAEIADQINLLSLNASIEAARAGDAGRGFAVVASEINKLASSTSEAVNQIRETITGVQDAFGSMSESSGELLAFIKETVAKDYSNFIEVAKQYGEDAVSFGEESSKIAQMTENIRSAVREVSKAVENIAESTQDTADRSSHVNDTVYEAADIVTNVNDMSSKQEEIAHILGDIVGNFKLK